MKHSPLCLSFAINRAKLNLICLPPQRLAADLGSAPELCFQNISRREARKKKHEPVFTRTFLDRCIFNSLQAEEGVLKWWGRGGGGTTWTAHGIRPE